MTNILHRGAAWLRSTLKTHASDSVRLVRGPHSTTISATVGRTLAERTTDTHGIVLTVGIRDYLIAAIDYRINGQRTEPQRGDLIIESDGVAFEVLPPSGEPPYRWTDTGRTTYRIHTVSK